MIGTTIWTQSGQLLYNSNTEWEHTDFMHLSHRPVGILTLQRLIVVTTPSYMALARTPEERPQLLLSGKLPLEVKFQMAMWLPGVGEQPTLSLEETANARPDELGTYGNNDNNNNNNNNNIDDVTYDVYKRTGHKMYTGSWQETIKSDILRCQQKKFSIWFIFNKTLTLHLKSYSSENLKNNLNGMRRSSKCTNSVYKYTHFCPVGNHPGTLKVTQSVTKSHGL